MEYSETAEEMSETNEKANKNDSNKNIVKLGTVKFSSPKATVEKQRQSEKMKKVSRRMKIKESLNEDLKGEDDATPHLAKDQTPHIFAHNPTKISKFNKIREEQKIEEFPQNESKEVEKVSSTKISISKLQTKLIKEESLKIDNPIPEEKIEELDLKSEIPNKEKIELGLEPISFDKYTEQDSLNFSQMQDPQDILAQSQKDKLDDNNLLTPDADIGLRSPKSENQNYEEIKEHRIQIEKGLFGLKVEMRKIEEDLSGIISKHFAELNELKDEFIQFQNEVKDNFLVTREEMHRRYTEFKAHINEILLEYKESILIIQSHVDNQLIINNRDRSDVGIIIDDLINKTTFHDEVSRNFHYAMIDIKDMINSIIETININYNLQKQDEKDRESIALMGLTQNTNTIDYQKNSEIPPISLDKNCLS